MKKEEKIAVTSLGYTANFSKSTRLEKRKTKRKLPAKFEEAKARLSKIKAFPS